MLLIRSVPILQTSDKDKIVRLLIALLLCLTLLPAYAAKVETDNPQLDEAFGILLGKNFAAKSKAIDQIVLSGHPGSFELISGILEGNLRLHKQSKRLVWIEKKDRKYQATDVFTNDILGEFKKRKLKKVSINNNLRRQIKSLLAIQDLKSIDSNLRLQAVQTMLTNPLPAHAQLIEPLIEKESNEAVRSAMQLVISLAFLSSDNPAERIQAINEVSESLYPEVRNKLAKMAVDDADLKVKKSAAKALKKIDERIKNYARIETLFFGLSAGSVLVLAAIGLAITFGVMGVINMAHGELIMMGAYTTYLIQAIMPDHITLALFLSIPAAFIVSGSIGIAIERGVIRFLYGRPLETLLATFGISLVLQQLVRTVISPQNVPVSNPEFMSGFWQVNSVLSLTYNRLYIILFCLIVFAALFVILKRTRLGLQVRAVSQNRAMARAMGVRSARVDALTFGLGSGIAGVAGVALSQLTNVGPNLGQTYIVDSFMVVVFGGVGNLWGTLISGLSLGIANKFMEPWAGAVMAKILILVAIILFIQKRPRGLFPQKGRAVEN